MNAPIVYFGGKGNMWEHIVAHFPPPKYDTYLEPFGGSFAVGLHKPYTPTFEIYNDLERNVYTLYKVIKDAEAFADFARTVALTPYHEDEWRTARETLSREDVTDVQRAVAFFIVNRMSHNGIGGFSVKGMERRGMEKVLSDYLSAVEGLEGLHRRLSRVCIYNRDGLELIEKYNTPNCLVYCDPPYEWSTRGTHRYAVDNDEEWHKRFVETCIRSHAKILISGYDCDTYAPLESHGFVKVQFDVKQMSGNYTPLTHTECLWKNYADGADADGQMEFAL